MDENGPLLARELLSRGVEPERISVIGDRPEQLEAALRDVLQLDLVVTSGGLGPTHDDRTIELLARAAGRELHVDEALEREIEGVVRVWRSVSGDPMTSSAGVRKQARRRRGRDLAGAAGTAPRPAPDRLCPRNRTARPARRLQRIWRTALERPELQALARANNPAHGILRFFGLPESAVAGVVAQAGGESDGLEVTICAHDLEVQIDLVIPPERRRSEAGGGGAP